jgi:ribosomal protein S27AE
VDFPSHRRHLGARESLVVLAFARRLESCPRCGHHDVRPSRRPRGLLLRLLGIRRHRCMACGAVVLAPKAARRTGERDAVA